MATWTFTPADTTEQTVEELINRIAYIMKHIDSKNVKRLNTNETNISSADGLTRIIGPVLKQFDSTNLLRLELGYDETTGKFSFKMYNVAGQLTFYTDDDGNAVYNGFVSADKIIGNIVTTQVLYAERGYIAELTVDELSTENKVKRYLDEDTSDVNYIRIKEMSVQWITASTDGLATVQATNRHLQPLFWTDNTKTATTLDDTGIEVTIYVYNELVKSEWAFILDPDSLEYIPTIELGAGTGTGLNGKAFIYKGVNGLYLDYYKGTTGEKLTAAITDDGFIGFGGGGADIEKLTDLKFYSNGFIATYETEALSYTWTKDIDGKITSLIDTLTGATVLVTWNGGTM